MITDRLEGCFYRAHDVDFNDFEYIVTASNIAGYFEAKDIINVNSDMELTEFILEEVDKYNKLVSSGSKVVFCEFIENALLREFAIKGD